MTKNSSRIRTLTHIAMFAAVLTICSQIAIPLPAGVPVTLQTFAMALAGYVLGAKNGTFSVLTWGIIGICGIPVFANFVGGPAAIFGKTGGFIYGFLFIAFFCGMGTQKSLPVKILLSVCGLLLCHLCGVLHFSVLTGIDPFKSALLVSFPFLIKDLLSLVVAERFSTVLHRAVAKTPAAF